MNDLFQGGAILCGAALLVGLVFAGIGHRTKGLTTGLIAAGVLLLTFLFVLYLHGRLILAAWVPYSNAIVLANWIPLGLAALAGLLGVQRAIPLWRRMALLSGIGLLAGYVLLQPLSALFQEPLPSANRWTPRGVLLQTNRASCSACAAAMLLGHHGIETNETEMMRRCLTNHEATPTLGLYRGLKLQTANTPVRVAPFHSTVDELLAADRWPAILLVRLELDFDADPRYATEWGWTPGVGHAVLVFGRVAEDRLDVGDPSVGREQWTTEDLHVLWQGEGIRLVPR